MPPKAAPAGVATAWHVCWQAAVGRQLFVDPALYAKAKEEGRIGEIPTNHNPRFAPVIHPTLETGLEAMVVAAQTWLSA